MEEPELRPWMLDPGRFGRLRVTEAMARENYVALRTYLAAKWKIHHELPNPSDEGRESLRQIRALEKVVASLEGLAEEKGWDLATTALDGSTSAATLDPPKSPPPTKT